MPQSYLSRFVNVVFVLILFMLWLMDSLLGMFVGLLLWVGLYFLFRKKKHDYKADIAFKRDVLFSPVHGKVESVRNHVSHVYFGKDMIELRLIVNPWDEMGVYLPMTSEVQDFHFKEGKTFFRYKKEELASQENDMLDGIALSLRDVQDRIVGLQFLKCIFGSWPEISLIPGDRGKQQANFGYFPFGGTVLLYIPQKYEILVNANDKLIAGEDLIARAVVQE